MKRGRVEDIVLLLPVPSEKGWAVERAFMPYDVKSLKILARGGQADIYEIDAGRILRVLRSPDPEDFDMLMGERALMAELCGRGLDVPEVFEDTQAGGNPAVVMQRVQGPSMLQRIAGNPLRMRGEAKTLARLHCEFLRCPAPERLMEIKERADILMDRSIHLDDGDRAFIRSLLAELPQGNALLHGDFHPGNILTQAGKYYVIDWFGAAMGDPLSDIAHTYLLCAYKPRIPSEGFLAYHLLKVAARMFGGMYLNQMRTRMGFDMGGFGRWLAVRAAERTAYGQPSELGPRADFVKACRAMKEKGIPPERWIRAL